MSDLPELPHDMTDRTGTPDDLAELARRVAGNVREIAFMLPPPNRITMLLVQQVVALESAAIATMAHRVAADERIMEALAALKEIAAGVEVQKNCRTVRVFIEGALSESGLRT